MASTVDRLATATGSPTVPRTQTLLVVDDEAALRAPMAEELRGEGYRVVEAATADEARRLFQSEPIDLALLDLRIGQDNGLELLRELNAERPDLATIMMTAFGQVEHAVEAIRLGAYDFLIKPFEFAKLTVALTNALRDQSLAAEVHYLRRRNQGRDRVVGEPAPDSPMAKVYREVERVAATKASVLLLGETGVGKDVIARRLHCLSAAREQPFVDVNCSALPAELLESELFGHERGAYTGAHAAKQGLFEIAHGGTVFLDEIGDMPVALQAKLLRVLESRSFRRLGGTREVRVDVRIVAATNQNLKERIAAGQFRSDLYFRLAVMEIRIPPLRDRPGDLDGLVHALLAQIEPELGRKVDTIQPRALELMRAYRWPGNVRELKNVLERAVILADDGQLGVAQLPDEIRAAATPGAARRRPRLEAAERAVILSTLADCEGNKTQAAKELGISRQTLRNKMNQFDID